MFNAYLTIICDMSVEAKQNKIKIKIKIHCRDILFVTPSLSVTSMNVARLVHEHHVARGLI